MARQPRLSVPGQLHHVQQHALPGLAVLGEEADRQLLGEQLGEQARLHSVELHSMVLLPNRFELLVTPVADGGLSRLMQAVGRRFVPAYNRRHARRGSPWEGRFRATILDAEAWLLDAMACLDLAPVRDGVARTAADYPWSSHGHYIGRQHDSRLSPHALYWSLGNTPFSRQVAYAQRVEQGLPPDRLAALSGAARHGWALGSEAFITQLQAMTSRRVERAKVGRPPRKIV